MQWNDEAALIGSAGGFVGYNLAARKGVNGHNGGGRMILEQTYEWVEGVIKVESLAGA